MSLDPNISQNLKEVFNCRAESISVYLRGTKEKGTSYDPFRNTGHNLTKKNPVFIKALVQTINADKLILKELGIIQAGAVALIVKTSDVAYLKIAEKIEINGEEFVTYHSALGNQAIIFKQRPLDLSKVILFKKSK